VAPGRCHPGPGRSRPGPSTQGDGPHADAFAQGLAALAEQLLDHGGAEHRHFAPLPRLRVVEHPSLSDRQVASREIVGRHALDLGVPVGAFGVELREAAHQRRGDGHAVHLFGDRLGVGPGDRNVLAGAQVDEPARPSARSRRDDDQVRAQAGDRLGDRLLRPQADGGHHHHGRHADHHPERSERASHRVGHDGAGGEADEFDAVQTPASARSSCSTTPSRKAMRRPAWAATLGSWVTTTTVSPSALRSPNSCSTS
jgi:hypothetical protein